MTDFIVMVQNSSYMFITGPDVIKATTHEEVTMQELGGAETHATRSGVCHLDVPDDQSALIAVREMLSYMPSNNLEDPPFQAPKEDPGRRDQALDSIVPENPNKPYDMREIILRVIDDGHFFEIQKDYAQNMLIGFARVGGYAVGVVANQPAVLAGCLDVLQAYPRRFQLRLSERRDRGDGSGRRGQHHF
jgi:propionyl-CoA carboxylase beta chain